MTGLQLNDTARDNLLGLGILTMYLSPERNVTMSDIVNEVASKPTLPSSEFLLRSIQNYLWDRQNTYGSSLSSTQGLMTIFNIFLKGQDDQGDMLVIQKNYSWIWIGLGGIFVLLRLYTKKFITKQIRCDDVLILLAWLGALFYQIFDFSVGGRETRCCYHVWNSTRNMLEDRLWFIYVSEILFVLVMGMTKLAVMTFYWNLVPRGSSEAFSFFHKAIVIVGSLATADFFAALFTVIFQCQPVAFWRDLPHAKCLPRLQLWVGLNAVMVVTDIMILALPVKLVFLLPLSRREKFIVMALLGLGGLSSVAGIPRVVAFAMLVDDPDITFRACGTNLWIQAEFNLAIITMCVPATRNLVLRYAPKLLTSSGNNQNREDHESVVEMIGPEVEKSRPRQVKNTENGLAQGNRASCLRTAVSFQVGTRVSRYLVPENLPTAENGTAVMRAPLAQSNKPPMKKLRRKRSTKPRSKSLSISPQQASTILGRSSSVRSQDQVPRAAGFGWPRIYRLRASAITKRRTTHPEPALQTNLQRSASTRSRRRAEWSPLGEVDSGGDLILSIFEEIDYRVAVALSEAIEKSLTEEQLDVSLAATIEATRIVVGEPKSRRWTWRLRPGTWG